MTAEMKPVAFDEKAARETAVRMAASKASAQSAPGDRIREAVARLAEMDEADYLACKKSAANELGITQPELNRLVTKARRGEGGKGRTFKIEPPEPWPIVGKTLVAPAICHHRRHLFPLQGRHQG